MSSLRNKIRARASAVAADLKTELRAHISPPEPIGKYSASTNATAERIEYRRRCRRDHHQQHRHRHHRLADHGDDVSDRKPVPGPSGAGALDGAAADVANGEEAEAEDLKEDRDAEEKLIAAFREVREKQKRQTVVDFGVSLSKVVGSGLQGDRKGGTEELREQQREELAAQHREAQWRVRAGSAKVERWLEGVEVGSGWEQDCCETECVQEVREGF